MYIYKELLCKFHLAGKVKPFDLHSEANATRMGRADHSAKSKRAGVHRWSHFRRASGQLSRAQTDQLIEFIIETQHSDIITKGLTRAWSRDNREAGKGICWWNFNWCRPAAERRQAPLIIAVEVRKIRAGGRTGTSNWGRGAHGTSPQSILRRHTVRVTYRVHHTGAPHTHLPSPLYLRPAD